MDPDDAAAKLTIQVPSPDRGHLGIIAEDEEDDDEEEVDVKEKEEEKGTTGHVADEIFDVVNTRLGLSGDELTVLSK